MAWGMGWGKSAHLGGFTYASLSHPGKPGGPDRKELARSGPLLGLNPREIAQGRLGQGEVSADFNLAQNKRL